VSEGLAQGPQHILEWDSNLQGTELTTKPSQKPCQEDKLIHRCYTKSSPDVCVCVYSF